MASSFSNSLQSLVDTQYQAAILLVVIMLGVEWLNPVLQVSIVVGVPPQTLSMGALIALMYLVWTRLDDVFYFGTKIFFQSINSIFFSHIDVIGLDNVPKVGPVIFTGNHMNQFVDGMLVITTTRLKIGFLIAQKSFERFVIGDIARAIGAIPVSRPQDSAVKGIGTVTFTHRTEFDQKQQIEVVRNIAIGTGTKFQTQFHSGDKICLKGYADAFKIVAIISDIELEVSNEVPEQVFNSTPFIFTIHQKIDQGSMFQHVFDALASGKCIGIFPEGGSHDRTDLLPLKAGIANIAFGVLEAKQLNVPIVPIGLNYFRGHRFRGRVVIEFGAPILISEDLMTMYSSNKRQATTDLLAEIEDGMRATIVTAKNYETLQLLYAARRLWQPIDRRLSPKEKQDMTRRFAYGFKLIEDKYSSSAGTGGVEVHDAVDDRLPEDIKTVAKKLFEYTESLKDLGIRDYQVPALQVIGIQSGLAKLGHMVIVFILALFPTLILNAPVGLLARFMASEERKKALKSSTVKIAARDVMLSKKIIISMVAVPTLWISYALIMLFYLHYSFRVVALLFLMCPLFSYFSVMAVEAGMMDLKDLRPAFLWLAPSYRKRAYALPSVRAELRRELHQVVCRYGADLGDLLTSKQINWGQMHAMRKTASQENLAKLQEESEAKH